MPPRAAPNGTGASARTCRSRALRRRLIGARSRAIAVRIARLACPLSIAEGREKISEFRLVLSSDQKSATTESDETSSLRMFVPK
jgi:hypothetical protein